MREHIVVIVDGARIVLPHRVVTGREIRRAAGIADTHDLYLKQPADDFEARSGHGGEDTFITDGHLIPAIIGRHFYSVPRVIGAQP